MKTADVLTKHGWKTQTNSSIWKHPKWTNEEIMVGPTGWFHTTPDINAPEGRRVVSRGATHADLEAYLDPKLNLSNDASGVPMAGQCSCGVNVDGGKVRITNKTEVKKRFEQEFSSHVARHHPFAPKDSR